MAQEPKKTNPEPITVVSGKLPIRPIIPTTPPKLQGVDYSPKFIEAGQEFSIILTFDQEISGLTMSDIMVTAPPQLLAWLMNGRLAGDRSSGQYKRTWWLTYDVSDAFDVSQLPDDYNIHIVIRESSIFGEGL